ncbi:MAG: hypothetical protein J0M33_00395 [Anaerolineae bacterium]|nr:hypothetical protein [Anaerolineae bacterium]
MTMTNASIPTRWTRTDTWRIVILISLTVLMMAPYLFTNPTPLIVANSDLGTDLTGEVYPQLKYVLGALREIGQVPTWRTYAMSGYPYIGHPVVPLFYPPNWTAPLLPLTLWINLHSTLHLIWAGVGMYLCLRYMTGVQPNATLVGALIFGHAPKFMAHISGGHVMMFATMTWFPWAWLCFHLFYQRGKPLYAVLLGITLAMHATTNGFYLAITALVLLVCAPFYLRTLAWRTWLWRSLLGGALSMLLLGGLAAAQFLPMLAIVRESHRTTLSLADSMSLDPALLLGMFFPFKLPIAEWFLYLGGGTILLALYGAIRDWRMARWWLLGILGVLILCVGPNTPVYTLLYEYMPGFSLFRVPQRFFPIAVFGFATLAALGTQRWLDDPRFNRGFRLVTLSLIMFYIGSLFLSASVGEGLGFYVFPYALALPAMALVLFFAPRLRPAFTRLAYVALVVVLLADLWIANHNLIRPSPEQVELRGDALVTAIAPLMNPGERTLAPYGRISQLNLVTQGISAADGYDPIQVKRYADFLARVVGCDFAGYSVGAPMMRNSAVAERDCPTLNANRDLLSMLNVRMVILPLDHPAPTPDAISVFTDDRRAAWDIGPGRGRAWLETNLTAVEPGVCLDTLTATPGMNVVEGPLPTDLTRLNNPGTVQVIDRLIPNGEAFQVEVSGAALLIRSETYATGWQATIDGSAASVYPANCALQGVWLPTAGSYEVIFTYAPPSIPLGLAISGATVLLLISYGGWLSLSAWRKHT